MLGKPHNGSLLLRDFNLWCTRTTRIGLTTTQCGRPVKLLYQSNPSAIVGYKAKKWTLDGWQKLQHTAVSSARMKCVVCD